MRIQHNIAALNSYRQLSGNNSALSKNLEKLSSGYKINRAGDDAAGLAISEKMRAQIKGLEAAQKNANDGISLVQTGEGALTEVHSMLNRMVYLANQSANGTYDNDTDRYQLQKEMNQLRDEIDRIADSTNFNGIKLLDGSMDSEDVETVNDPTFANLDKFTKYGNRFDGVEKDDGAGNKIEAGPQLHKEASGSARTSFEFDINGRSIKANDQGKIEFNLQMARQNTNGPTNDAEFAYAKKITIEGLNPGEELSADKLAQKIVSQLGNDGKIELQFEAGKAYAIDDNDGTITDNSADANGIEYQVTAVGSKLVFEMTSNGYDTAADTTKYPREGGTAITDNVDPFQGNFTIGFGNVTGTNNSTNDVGSSNIVVGNTASGDKLAETIVNFNQVLTSDGTLNGKVKDGAGVKIGDTSYVFAASDETFNGKYGDNVKIVDIRDLVDKDTGKFKAAATNGTAQGNKTDGIVLSISRLTEAAKGNKMFNVQQSYGHWDLALTEKADYNGNGKDGRADLTTEEGLKEQIKFFTGITANVDVKKATGKALTLQIGDTSDTFNKLKVNIKDMHTSSLGLDKVSISDQESAADAVDAIKKAINTVSDIRGGMGAIQNRLEHTINNLGVQTENITAAESRIRDTDMAEEMMAYTKNNILVQAAQAMLAQANQVPQGVLQLLQ